MNSGRVNGAAGLSARTDVIHTSRSGSVKGNARNNTALTTENTAMLTPIASTSVETTASTNPGWRRNWRIARERSFNIHSPFEAILTNQDTSICDTDPLKSAIMRVPLAKHFNAAA